MSCDPACYIWHTGPDPGTRRQAELAWDSAVLITRGGWQWCGPWSSDPKVWGWAETARVSRGLIPSNGARRRRSGPPGPIQAHGARQRPHGALGPDPGTWGLISPVDWSHTTHLAHTAKRLSTSAIEDQPIGNTWFWFMSALLAGPGLNPLCCSALISGLTYG